MILLLTLLATKSASPFGDSTTAEGMLSVATALPFAVNFPVLRSMV